MFSGYSLLREEDSNLQPPGYTGPYVSARGGLSHHPVHLLDAGRYGIYWLDSSIPSLCTFPATVIAFCDHLCPSLGLAQDYHRAYARTGFPEFTRFFAARYRTVLLDHASENESPLASVHHSRTLCRLSYRGIFNCGVLYPKRRASQTKVRAV